MHFGFSYVGLLYLIMLFVPNFFWMKNQPRDYEKYVVNENKILQVLERAGEVLVSCFVLVFTDYNIKGISLWSIWFFASFFLMVLYECYWIRYFRSPKTMQDFYSSMLGIPVAGATLPVCAFFLLAVYGKNPLLMAAAVLLGAGHIGIHLCHAVEMNKTGG